VLTRAHGSISRVDRESYFLFLGGACAEPSSSDEWSGVANGDVLADGRGKLLHYFGHVLDSSIVKKWGGHADRIQHVSKRKCRPIRRVEWCF